MCYDFGLVDFWQVDWQHTPISRKIVGKICTRQSRKVTWHMINTLFLMYCSCQTYFCCLPLAFTNIHVHPWPLVLFFQISLKNNELKPPTIPFGIVACTFSDNLSRNRCNLCKHNNGFPVLSPRCLPSSTLKISTTNGSLSLNNNLLDEVFVTSEMIKLYF